MLAQSKIHPAIKVSTDIADFEQVLRQATDLFARRNFNHRLLLARTKSGRLAHYSRRRSGSAA